MLVLYVIGHGVLSTKSAIYAYDGAGEVGLLLGMVLAVYFVIYAALCLTAQRLRDVNSPVGVRFFVWFP
jgi:uncharacterized membrane protein YhaH (DUF805 family)